MHSPSRPTAGRTTSRTSTSTSPHTNAAPPSSSDASSPSDSCTTAPLNLPLSSASLPRTPRLRTSATTDRKTISACAKNSKTQAHSTLPSQNPSTAWQLSSKAIAKKSTGSKSTSSFGIIKRKTPNVHNHLNTSLDFFYKEYNGYGQYTVDKKIITNKKKSFSINNMIIEIYSTIYCTIK